MKIKLKIEAFRRPPGTEIEVADEIGKQFVDAGDATEVKESPKAKRIDGDKLRNKSLSAAG